MKIFPRYIARHFWGPFVAGLCVFAILIFLADSFESLNAFIKSKASAGTLFYYLFLRLPYWIMKIVPIATLFAVLFSIGALTASGELKAAMASGYHPGQAVLPLILCSAAVAAGHFVFQERFATPSFTKAEIIYHKDIKKDGKLPSGIFRNASLSAGRGRFLFVQELDVKSKTMKRVMAEFHGNNEPAFQVDALSADWDPARGKWIFRNGVERRFQKSGQTAEHIFAEWASDINIPAESLFVENTDAENITIKEGLRRIRSLKKTEAPYFKEMTAVQSKIAFSFSSVIMSLLGISFALAVKKANRLFYFGAAISVAFVFWWIMSISQAAGESGFLPAWLAAWGPLLVFAGISVYGLKKTGVIP